MATAEISAAIQARIEEVNDSQVPAMNRLRALGVPEPMIQRAAKAEEDAYEVAELTIITWAREEHNFSDEDAVRFLNGKKQM
jgi:hypothetical protein